MSCPSSTPRPALGMPTPPQITHWATYLLFPRAILCQVENRESPCYHQPQPLKGEKDGGVSCGQPCLHSECSEKGPSHRPPVIFFYLVNINISGYIPEGRPPVPFLCPEALPAHLHTHLSIALAWRPCLPVPWAYPAHPGIPGRGEVLNVLPNSLFSHLLPCATAATRGRYWPMAGKHAATTRGKPRPGRGPSPPQPHLCVDADGSNGRDLKIVTCKGRRCGFDWHSKARSTGGNVSWVHLQHSVYCDSPPTPLCSLPLPWHCDQSYRRG